MKPTPSRDDLSGGYDSTRKFSNDSSSFRKHRKVSLSSHVLVLNHGLSSSMPNSRKLFIDFFLMRSGWETWWSWFFRQQSTRRWADAEKTITKRCWQVESFVFCAMCRQLFILERNQVTCDDNESVSNIQCHLKRPCEWYTVGLGFLSCWHGY